MEQLLSTIGLEELLNCILVEKDARPAMLIQPADYDEATYKDPKTAAKLIAIKQHFPELIQSFVGGGEIIISKHKISPEDITENAIMGKILGYPCYADYQYTLDNKDAIKVRIEIIVNLKPGLNNDNLQLLAYVCRDERFFAESQAFAKKCEDVLKADPLVGKLIDSVSAKKTVIMPAKYLINKLVNNEEITQSEKGEIIDKIWNLGFPEKEGGKVIKINYQFQNPVHRGMIIALLTVYDNNQMKPFWPLQYRKERRQVDKISVAWAKELIRTFRETESADGAGLTRKTRRNRRRSSLIT